MSYNYTSCIELNKLRCVGKVTTRQYLTERNNLLLTLFPDDPGKCILPIFKDFPNTCSMGGQYGTPCPHKEWCKENHKK